jgi:hypothetical protein
VTEAESALAAEVGVVVFRQAFARWVEAADDERGLDDHVADLFAQLRSVTAAG